MQRPSESVQAKVPSPPFPVALPEKEWGLGPLDSSPTVEAKTRPSVEIPSSIGNFLGNPHPPTPWLSSQPQTLYSDLTRPASEVLPETGRDARKEERESRGERRGEFEEEKRGEERSEEGRGQRRVDRGRGRGERGWEGGREEEREGEGEYQ